MKTLKELHERGINYLIGYIDALKDIAQEIIDNEDLYDPSNNQAILKFMNDYIMDMLKEATHENSAANR